MLYLLTVFVVLIISLVLWLKYKHIWQVEVYLMIFLTLASTVLAGSLITLAITQADAIAQMQDVKAIQATLDTARNSGVADAELVGFQVEVAKINSWIARVQHWQASKWVSVYYPSAVANLEFVR